MVARPGCRNGFALVELIVALAILVMVAATVVPIMVSALDQARVENAVQAFEALGESIEAFEDDVNEWPGQLSQLSTTITTSMRNACNTLYNNGDVNDWEGPYTMRIISESGLPVFIGVADNQLIRIPLGGNSAILLVRVPSVSEEDTLEMDRQVDAEDGNLAGSIFWEPAANGMTNLYHAYAINAGC